MTQNNFPLAAGKRVPIREMLKSGISLDPPGAAVTQSAWYQDRLFRLDGSACTSAGFRASSADHHFSGFGPVRPRLVIVCHHLKATAVSTRPSVSHSAMGPSSRWTRGFAALGWRVSGLARCSWKPRRVSLLLGFKRAAQTFVT